MLHLPQLENFTYEELSKKYSRLSRVDFRRTIRDFARKNYPDKYREDDFLTYPIIVKLHNESNDLFYMKKLRRIASKQFKYLYKESDFNELVEKKKGKIISFNKQPITETVYLNLVDMHNASKDKNYRARCKRKAKRDCATQFCNADFNNLNRSYYYDLSYNGKIKAYNNSRDYTTKKHIKKLAKKNNPGDYKESDFLSMSVHKYKTLTYTDHVDGYEKSNSVNERSGFRKSAKRKFPKLFNANDFNTKSITVVTMISRFTGISNIMLTNRYPSLKGVR